MQSRKSNIASPHQRPRTTRPAQQQRLLTRPSRCASSIFRSSARLHSFNDDADFIIPSFTSASRHQKPTSSSLQRRQKQQQQQQHAHESRSSSRNASNNNNNNNIPSLESISASDSSTELSQLPVLNRMISSSRFFSRRQAAFLIKTGRVLVNNTTFIEPGYRVKPDDLVQVRMPDGKLRTMQNQLNAESRVYLFHKPRGYVCSRSKISRNTSNHAKHNTTPTIFELLPPNLRDLYYCGRLDMPSSGLLVLSSNGDYINKVTHPSCRIEKEYVVSCLFPITEEHIDKMLLGIEDEGEVLQARRISPLPKMDPNNHQELPRYSFVLTKGLKREVRRLVAFQAGNQVTELHRIRIGSLLLTDVPTGEIVKLTEEQAQMVFKPFEFDYFATSVADHCIPTDTNFSSFSQRSRMPPIISQRIQRLHARSQKQSRSPTMTSNITSIDQQQQRLSHFDDNHNAEDVDDDDDDDDFYDNNDSYSSFQDSSFYQKHSY